MQAYSMDLRLRVVDAKQEGHSSDEVAKRYNLSTRTVDRYWKQFQEKGHFQPGQHGGHRLSRLRDCDEKLKSWIARKPDLTLPEIQERLHKKLGIVIGQTALWHRLNKLGLTYKKNAARRRAKPPGRAPEAP